MNLGIAFIESLQKEMKSYEDKMNRTEREMINAKDRIYDLTDRVSEIEDLRVSCSVGIYYIKDVEKRVGRNRQTLRRWWESDDFPKPTLIQDRLAWRSETIEEWITKQFTALGENDND